jgi:hypothetical protein
MQFFCENKGLYIISDMLLWLQAAGVFGMTGKTIIKSDQFVELDLVFCFLPNN